MIGQQQVLRVQLWLIPLDYALPALQAYLGGKNDEPLTSAETVAAAELLERCVRTGEVLVVFALYLSGRPSQQ